MKKFIVIFFSVLSLSLITSPIAFCAKIIKLPVPVSHVMSFEETLQLRRSTRDFSADPLSLQQVAQLLWAAQGVTSSDGLRVVPSAGSLFPLEIFVVVGRVKDLSPGVYRYHSRQHALSLVANGDRRSTLKKAALNQMAIEQAPIDIIITGVYKRVIKTYKVRGIRYVQMESGHVAQNISLQAVAMKLGSVPISAFNDQEVTKILDIPSDYYPLYIIPIGKL